MESSQSKNEHQMTDCKLLLLTDQNFLSFFSKPERLITFERVKLQSILKCGAGNFMCNALNINQIGQSFFCIHHHNQDQKKTDHS